MNYTESKNIVVVGALAYDSVLIIDRLPVDEKIEAEHAYQALGGGGGNVAILIKEMQDIFRSSISVDLFTKIGKPSPQYRTRPIALEALSGIHVEDMVAQQSYNIPENTILAHPQGRIVVKKPRLSPDFNTETTLVDAGVSQKMETSIAKADLVILQTNYPEVAERAARIAKDYGVPVMIDYSISDAAKASALHQTLLLSDYILAPGESKLSGMKHADAEQLYELFKERYPNALVSVSNGANPVMTHYRGADHQMEIERVAKVVDQLGTGDTRTALFAFFLIYGDDPLLALKKSSACSTLSVQYPGREWLAQMPEFIRSRELFGVQVGNVRQLAKRR